MEGFKGFLARWFALRSMLTGAVVLTVLAFSTHTVVFAGSAQSAQAAAVKTAITDTQSAILTPMCIAASKTDPLVSDRVAELKATSSYQRSDLIIGYGWTADKNIASTCADQILAG